MGKQPKNLNYDYLIDNYIYDYTKGLVYRKKPTHRNSVGDEMGYNMGNGYKRLYVGNNNKASFARACWVMFYGKNPHGEIDHIDGNPLNNKICNLRDVTKSQNAMNKKAIGVTLCGDCKVEKYRARIKIKSKEINLGRFNTMREAIEARRLGEEKYFGKYRRVS